MGVIENYVKEQKLVALENNYAAAKEFLVIGPRSYRITQENITDIIGLVALNVGSDLGVMENDELQLVNHTALELKDLLESIRVHLTGIKTARFNKRAELAALEDHETIMNFDVSL